MLCLAESVRGVTVRLDDGRACPSNGGLCTFAGCMKVGMVAPVKRFGPAETAVSLVTSGLAASMIITHWMLEGV